MFLEYGNTSIRFKYRPIVGRSIDLDLSSPDKEYAKKLFPLNQILDFAKVMVWQNGYQAYHNFDANAAQLFLKFSTEVITMVQRYVMPVITLDKGTSKEAVCRVFENVNTGGVSLPVFELVTAVFAMDDFELRKDWELRKETYFNSDILFGVTATDFLTALTLLASYKRGGIVSCKKKDVLNLSLQDYLAYSDSLTEGFVEAEKILQEERIFVSRDLPYTTQLIPLAALCTVLQAGNQIKVTNVKSQRPRCKQRGIKFVALQSSGVFDPRGSRQMCMQACPLGSLLAGIKLSSGIGAACSANCTVRPMRPDMPMTLCR